MNHMPFPSHPSNENSFAGSSMLQGNPKVPWNRAKPTGPAPIMFQVHFCDGRVVSYAYCDLREIRLRDAGYLQLCLLGMEKFYITLEGRNLTELADLIGTANTNFPEAEPRVLLQPQVEDTAVTVILKKPHEPRDSGGTMINMHPYTGETMGWTDFTDGEMGHQAVYWMLHLHKGTWGGIIAGPSGKLATRIVWVVSAIAAVTLTIIGAAGWYYYQGNLTNAPLTVQQD